MEYTNFFGEKRAIYLASTIAFDHLLEWDLSLTNSLLRNSDYNRFAQFSKINAFLYTDLFVNSASARVRL